MTDIFISYQREDDVRVAPIVEGLRGAGLSVWWDRDISSGQTWRQATSEQLEAARCVIVIWSEKSVGPLGELVHDVAERAKDRGVLVPVQIDRVAQPLGFGEIQSFSLVGWRGNRRNSRFQNLVAATKAVVTGGPRPRPMTSGRLARLLVTWGGGFGVAATILGFATDLAGLQGLICKIPGVHAVCASQGLGDLPTKDEEIFWTQRVAGDCEGLRAYLARFPKGAYAEEAGRMLQAAEIIEEESWTPGVQRLQLTIRTTLAPLASEEAARADALTRGSTEAARACEGFNLGEFRLVSTEPEAQIWRCSARGSGFVCGFDGQAICKIEARRITQRQVCK